MIHDLISFKSNWFYSSAVLEKKYIISKEKEINSKRKEEKQLKKNGEDEKKKPMIFKNIAYFLRYLILLPE